MKRIATYLLLAFAIITARAGDQPAANAYFTESYTTNFSGLNTNVVFGTNYIENNLYHTFYFTSTSNLNGCTAAIAFSNDSTNWNTWGTVALPLTASAAQNVMTNCLFKQSYYRVTFTGTNLTGKFNYLGGR